MTQISKEKIVEAVLDTLNKYHVDCDNYGIAEEIADIILASYNINRINSLLAGQESEIQCEHCDEPIPCDYLNECIEKATPNLSKIKDVDKELDEIRGVQPAKAEAKTAEENYIFASSINKGLSGIISTTNPPKIICFCNEEQSKLIIKALNASQQPTKEIKGMTAEDYIRNKMFNSSNDDDWIELYDEKEYLFHEIVAWFKSYASQQPLTDEEIENNFPTAGDRTLTMADWAIKENKLRQEGAKAYRDGKIKPNTK